MVDLLLLKLSHFQGNGTDIRQLTDRFSLNILLVSLSPTPLLSF